MEEEMETIGRRCAFKFCAASLKVYLHFVGCMEEVNY